MNEQTVKRFAVFARRSRFVHLGDRYGCHAGGSAQYAGSPRESR